MAASLKDKRQVVKSVKSRLRNEFNIAISEVDYLNTKQTAALVVRSWMQEDR